MPDMSWSQRCDFIRSKYGVSDGDPDAQPLPRASDVCVGLLYVVVARCRDLAVKESSGYSDPHCIVTLGNSSRKTHTIENSTSPVWNESLLGFKWNGNDVLQCRVFDTDSLSADAAHGTAFVSLEGIPEAVEQSITVPLRGAITGQLVLELTLQRN